VEDRLPEKNKYTNFKNIDTNVYTDLSKHKITKFVNFIRRHYLKNKENEYLPKKENIIPYFVGHNTKSFVTFYYDDQLLYDLKKGTAISDKQIVSVMTSRPVHITILNNDAKFDAYYVDYLCVDKLHRKKGIAPQMIQTHEYNQRHLNKNICISLFKREEELTGIVPLCVYSTYGFSVTKWTKPPNLHPIYKWIEINEQNYHFLHDFIKANSSQFDILIMSEVANIIELIKTKNIFICTLFLENEIIAAYFYRKTCVFIEKGLEVLTCIASIKGKVDTDIFIQGFKISFWKIAAENNFGFAALEDISDNDMIIQNIKKKTAPLIVSPTAYFFYNFIYSTFNAKRVFILN
jgi:GNAT superfamily N-acetyltransferase